MFPEIYDVIEEHIPLETGQYQQFHSPIVSQQQNRQVLGRASSAANLYHAPTFFHRTSSAANLFNNSCTLRILFNHFSCKKKKRTLDDKLGSFAQPF